MDTHNREFRTLVVTLVIVAGLIILSIYGSLYLQPARWEGERLTLGATAPARLPPGPAETLLTRIDDLIRPAVAYLEINGCGDGAAQSRGSGLVVHEEGFIVTNAHVVEGAEWVCVSLEGHERLPGAVFGINAATDLAIVKVETTERLPTVVLGDSDALQVGEFVVAQGAPFGLRASMSVGIVSGLNRRVGLSAYEDYIVTDASINRGNSGGPLVNLDGEVIGINTAILAGDQGPHGESGYSGLGFAIPINVVKEVAGRLIGEGNVSRAEIVDDRGAESGLSHSDGEPAEGEDRFARKDGAEDIALAVSVVHLVSEAPGGVVLTRGTAFAISPDGHFLTNAHVVEGAEAVRAITEDGTELMATVLGQDPHTDLAVISVATAVPMPESPFGDSDALEIGGVVVAVGSPVPMELSRVSASVTDVNVGGLGLATYQGLIQFDREIQPGSSGGPLLNSDGKVVGLLTAFGQGDPDAAEEGTEFGYAIPINEAREVADALIADGRVLRSYAGFGGMPAPAGISGEADGGGVLIVHLAPDGPAARAGLEVHDVILEADGVPIRDGRIWQQYELPQIPPGTVIVFTVLRNQERLQIEVTLDELREEASEDVGA